MSVFTIEAGIALLGLVLLLVEAFKPDISRRALGLTAIAGTALALVMLLVVRHDTASLPSFMQPWHQLDTLALFYKGFALVITLLVLWLTLECAPYLTRFTVDGKLAEMFSLPLIVCSGMMWMASARQLLRPRRLRPQKRLQSRSWRQIPHPRRSFDRHPRLWHRLDLRCHRHDEL
jgi:NADH-quinone oxidoreductase subunit N